MLPFRQVDVFSAQPWRGNPLAVVHDADAVSDEAMARFARWTNLSETTFLCAPTDARAVSEHNWRPLVSYQANLDRIRQALLSSDAAWDRLAKLNPSKRREEMFENVRGPRYPWYWSAAVLVGLFGLSACTLNFTIKSLDRLK